MNGEPLPAVHGFPARLVVPGLYGYVSATKWLSEIHLTGWDVEGYWIPRGWAKEGPIKTQSRIDVSRRGRSVQPGVQPIAGVAWAPTRGIERVEVRIDDGPWEEAELAGGLDVDCWRQWVLRWDATPGRHVVAVRATDGLGEVQTDQRTPVAPDGASGHHTIEVGRGVTLAPGARHRPPRARGGRRLIHSVAGHQGGQLQDDATILLVEWWDIGADD